jgi:hypothetical protein
MVDSPCDTPVTRPVVLTVATASDDEAQLTALFSASSGDTVAVNCFVPLIAIV